MNKVDPRASFQVNIANTAAEFIPTGHPSSKGSYGQESGRFSRPGENQSMSGSDNQGKKRGGFGHGGGSGETGPGKQSGPRLVNSR